MEVLFFASLEISLPNLILLMHEVPCLVNILVWHLIELYIVAISSCG